MQGSITISTPSRLHFSLVDMNGMLGRVDGGFGVALERPRTILRCSIANKDDYNSNLRNIVNKLRENKIGKHKYKIEPLALIPTHVGLGSKTQLSLAVAKGISVLEGKELDDRELAHIVGRGGTSGIGVASFSSGGFIVDGGHSTKVKEGFSPSRYSVAPPPPVIARFSVPKTWHFVVAIPDGMGTHGKDELRVFREYCPIPARDVERLTRVLFSIILPSVVEHDIGNFGKGIWMVQNVGFKKIENRLRGKAHMRLLEFMNERSSGAGLSSFGPATFAIVEGKRDAVRLADEVREYMATHRLGSNAFITRASNSGARIELEP